MDTKEDSKRKVKQSFENGTFDYDQAVESWTQCCEFIRNKKRFCNMERSPNSRYCGTHRPSDEDPSKRHRKSCEKKGVPLTRINCPIDPSHSIYAHNLEKHIQICNIKTRNDLLVKESYFKENCNSGEINEYLELLPSQSPSSTSGKTSVDANILLTKIKHAFSNIETTNFTNPHHEDFNSMTNKKEVSTIDNHDESPLLLEMKKTVLQAVAEGQSSDDKLRHAQQDFKIILQMLKFGMISCTMEELNNNNNNKTTTISPQVFIELGAGKGMLGLAVHSVKPNSTIVLVERSGAKRKADKLLRSNGGQFYRARMDIRHCLISQLPGVGNVSILYSLLLLYGLCYYIVIAILIIVNTINILTVLRYNNYILLRNTNGYILYMLLYRPPNQSILIIYLRMDHLYCSII